MRTEETIKESTAVGLGSLAFPGLLPRGELDAWDRAPSISFTDRKRHPTPYESLLRFSNMRIRELNGKWQNRFWVHPTFLAVNLNRLQRQDVLTETRLFLTEENITWVT